MDSELTLAPADNTSLIFGMSLLHTNIEDVPIGVDPQNPIYVDRDAPQSPDFTFSGTIIQDFPLEIGNISVQFSGYYNDGYYSQLTNAPNTKIPSFKVYNGRLSFTDNNERYQVSVFAKNMFNEKYYSYAFDIASNGFTEQTLGNRAGWVWKAATTSRP